MGSILKTTYNKIAEADVLVIKKVISPLMIFLEKKLSWNAFIVAHILIIIAYLSLGYAFLTFDGVPNILRILACVLIGVAIWQKLKEIFNYKKRVVGDFKERYSDKFNSFLRFLLLPFVLVVLFVSASLVLKIYLVCYSLHYYIEAVC